MNPTDRIIQPDRPGFKLAGEDSRPVKAMMPEFDNLRKLAEMLNGDVERITERLRPVLARLEPEPLEPPDREMAKHMLDESIFDLEDKLIIVRERLQALLQRITF